MERVDLYTLAGQANGLVGVLLAHRQPSSCEPTASKYLQRDGDADASLDH